MQGTRARSRIVGSGSSPTWDRITMNKLKLNVEDLSVESFAPAETPRDRGTVQGHDSEEVLLPADDTQSYDMVCGGADYAGSVYCSRFTCPWNFSCRNNCSFGHC